jgi:hypothetical protein
MPGQQLIMDAYSHPHQSRSKAYYCDFITCLDSGLIIPVFTNNRSAPELCHQISSSLFCYPARQHAHEGLHRFVRVDPENNYLSEEFKELLFKFGYEREVAPNGTNMRMVAPNVQLVCCHAVCQRASGLLGPRHNLRLPDSLI